MFFESLLRYFLGHPVAANLLMCMLLLLGIYSANRIPQEIFPEFQPPEIQIEVKLPAGNVERIENAVLQPIESALKGEKGIKQIISQAEAGQASVAIELDRDASKDEMLGVIKSLIDGIEVFPEELEGLVIKPRDNRSQLLWLHLTGKDDVIQMLPEAEALKEQLLKLPSVSQIELVGVPDQEVEISINPDQLVALGISLNNLQTVLKTNNLDLDAGELKAEKRASLVARNEQVDPESLSQLPIYLGKPNHTIFLGEFAKIRNKFTEPDTVSRLNGKPAIGLALYRATDSDPVAAVTEVDEFVKQYQLALAKKMNITLWLDESRELESRLTLLTKNGFYGLLLVLALLVLLTHWKVALWVALGIPVVYLAAVWGMTLPGVGLSLNVITLFGFLIVSGILVDDALVVSESIYSQYEKPQLNNSSNSDQAISMSMQGIHKVAVPAVFGVLTTIAAFLPLTQLDGDLGHAIGAVSVVIILCLIFSIVESKLILPAHIHHGFIGNGSKLPDQSHRISQRVLTALSGCYQKLLNRVLNRPGFVLSLALSALIIAISAVSSGWLPTTMLPNIADYELEAELQTPISSTLVEQGEVVRDIEAAMHRANQALKQTYSLPYYPMANMFVVNESRRNLRFVAEMMPETSNPVPLTEFVKHWKQQLPDLPQGYSFSLSATAEPEDGINVQLEGIELQTLVSAAKELKEVLSAYPGVSDIRDNYGMEQKEFRLRLSSEAEMQGISLSQVTRAVREAVYGLEVQRVQLPGKEIKIVLRYPANWRDQLSDISQLPVFINGYWYVLNQLVQLEPYKGLASITRVNGQRAINVYANNDDSVVTADQVMDNLEDGYLETLVRRYPGLTYRVEGEARESEEIQVSLIIATLLAVFAIYALLALPLQSYWQPLLIMSVVPFSFTGVILAHWMMSIPINMMSFFGSIALIGVLVNDSLVLMYQLKLEFETDQKNSQSSDNLGMPYKGMDQAKPQTLKKLLTETCRNRFRPIVMTSVTTFLGVMPIIFESDPEALWLVPIALSLGVGVLFGTLVTLIILPSLVMLTKGFGIFSDSITNSSISLEIPALIEFEKH